MIKIIIFNFVFISALLFGNAAYSQKFIISLDTVQIDSLNYPFYLDYSKRLLNNYKLQDSKVLSEKLYVFDTTNLDGILQCAEVYSALNNTENVIRYYQKAIEADTVNIYPYIKLGDFYQKNNKIVEAINCYAPIVSSLDTLNYFALKQSGICILLLGNPMVFDLAISYLKRAINVNPYDLSLYFRIANTYNNLHKFDESIDICNKGLAIDSLDNYILNALAVAQYNKSDFKNAALNFEQVYQLGDSTSIVTKFLGFTYYKLNKFEIAKDYLTRASKKLEDEGIIDYSVYLFLCDIYLQSNNSKMASYWINHADSLKYPSPDIQGKLYKSFAYIYNSERDWGNGAKYFELSYKAWPEDIHSLLMLAYQYDYLKDKIKAYDSYSLFLKNADPEEYQKELPLVKQRISKLKEDLFFEGNTPR